MTPITSKNKQSGFTLVELMVTVVVSFIVTAAVVSSYKVQQKNTTAQQQITEIQQNIRAALEVMSQDFRMAGYDPTAEGRYNIDVANVSSFEFSADLCENGDLPREPWQTCGTGPYAAQHLIEKYNYRLNNDKTITRTTVPAGTPPTIIAENIESIELLYILDTGSQSLAPIGAQRDNIRAVRVSILGRAAKPDYNYINTTRYMTGSGVLMLPFNDNYRRRMLVKTIYCRNMGLI